MPETPQAAKAFASEAEKTGTLGGTGKLVRTGGIARTEERPRRVVAWSGPFFQHHLLVVAAHLQAAQKTVAQQHIGQGVRHDHGFHVLYFDFADAYRIELQPPALPPSALPSACR